MQNTLNTSENLETSTSFCQLHLSSNSVLFQALSQVLPPFSTWPTIFPCLYAVQRGASHRLLAPLFMLVWLHPGSC